VAKQNPNTVRTRSSQSPVTIAAMTTWISSAAQARLRRRQRARLAGAVAAAAAAGLALAFAVVGPTYGTRDSGASEPTAAGPCAAGPAQLAAETYIAAHREYGAVTADGRQSPGDCAAIRALQERFDVQSPSGSADALTAALVGRLNAARVGECPAGGGPLLICVDLTTQTMWAVRDGQTVLGPTIIRSGRPGEQTPTGDFTITTKKKHTVSTITGTPMEFWQHLRDGFGFHQAWTYLHDPAVPGSLGCVNMTRKDSADLFALTAPGTAVHIFGRKPGT
jgi:lipoprotein-anchoring transpeptidase ErfK/SrfK